MKIIKYTLNALAAIFTIGAIFTACSEKELADENEKSLDKKGYTLTIEATKAAPTKALAEAGGNIVASWAKGETVSVLNSSNVEIGELTAQYSGVSTVLSGELETAPAVDEVLTLEFCSASYTAQNGTLEYIASNCDYATANVTVKTVDNNTITTTAHANFVNHQAIVKFTLKNDAAQPAAINLSELTIKVSGSASDVTVTPASATSELYVALPAVADGSIELIGTVAPKTYTYARNGVTFENGKFYPITVNMTSAVAKIGDAKYDSLAEAIAAVPDNGQNPTTITMIANETMAVNTVIEIAATKNIILDLNGKTITATGGSASESYYFIQNRGTLEITDLSSGKNGKITSACTNPSPGYSKEYVTIYNIGGNLTLTEGTVEITSGGLSYAINNSSNAWGNGDDKETVFNMTGGTINSPSGDAGLRVYQNCAQNANPYSHNTVNISGGTIASGGIFLDNYIYNPNVNTTGAGINTSVTISDGEIHGLIDVKLRHAFNTTFTINGGTFVDSKLWVRKHSEWNDDAVAEPTTPLFFINDGNFTFVNDMAFGLAYDCEGTTWTSYTNPYSITGGTFNVDPSAHVAVGYAATQSGNVYTVGQIQGVAAIGSQGYNSLAAAVAAANSGDTITLIADDNVSLTGGSELTIDKQLTITGAVDAQGSPLYTIYGNNDATGTNYISINGSENVTLQNLKIRNFGNNANTNSKHAPLYVSSNYTGKITLSNIYVSEFNRGGIFLYGGEFNVENCYIDCANSRSDAFTKGIEVKESAHGTISDTFICNMERSSTKYSTAGIEIYGNGSIVVDNCTIVSNNGSHSTTKGTYGIVSSRVGDHNPSGGSTLVKDCIFDCTNACLSVADDDEYGPVNNYSFTVEGCYFANYIATWSATSSITINSGSFAEDVYADAGTITINGGEFGNFAPDTGTGGSIVIYGGTFDSDPSAYVASGYAATHEGNIWTVGAAPMDYATFNAALYAAGGVWTEAVTVVLKESQRDIFNNGGAQFYLGRTSANINGTEGDITVKNVTFTYDADDSSVSLEKFGELQIPLTGTLTFENCTFIGVSVSPWSTLASPQTNYPQKAEFKNCTFRDLNNRYGVHQNEAKTLVVTGCTFNTMERGIHTNCPEPVKIEIKNNTFTGIDSTKGVLCIAENSRGRITGDTVVDVSGNIAEGQAFLRLPTYNDIITLAQANAILEGNTYGNAYVEGGMIPTE